MRKKTICLKALITVLSLCVCGVTYWLPLCQAGEYDKNTNAPITAERETVSGGMQRFTIRLTTIQSSALGKLLRSVVPRILTETTHHVQIMNNVEEGFYHVNVGYFASREHALQGIDRLPDPLRSFAPYVLSLPSLPEAENDVSGDQVFTKMMEGATLFTRLEQ